MRLLWRTLLCLNLIVITTPSCGSKETRVNYDPRANFTTFKTYLYQKGTPAENRLIDRRIVAAIELEMSKKGFTRVDTNADVVVTQRAVFVESSALRGRDHLEKAGIWEELEK